MCPLACRLMILPVSFCWWHAAVINILQRNPQGSRQLLQIIAPRVRLSIVLECRHISLRDRRLLCEVY
jgi:hypothetical protein